MSDFPVRDYTQEQNGSSTMKMAVSVSKDCWDAEILLPQKRDVTLLFKFMRVDFFPFCVL